MELRVKAARTTRDIDLALKQLPSFVAGWEASAGTVLEMLREAAGTDSQDYFTFLIGEAVQDLDAAPYGGARFPVEARLAGRTFAKFRLDVALAMFCASPTLCSPVETGLDLLASRLCRSQQFLPRNSLPKRSTRTHYREKAAKTPA